MTVHQLKTAPPQAAPAQSAAPPLPPALEALAAKARGFADLPPGWEPYDGKTPTAKAIENAVAFLRLLPPGARPPDLGPRGDGGVGVDWDRHEVAGGPHLGLAFLADGTWGWFGEAPGLGGSDVEEIPFRPEEGIPETLGPWLDAVCRA